MADEPLTNRECRLLWALEVAAAHIAVYPRLSDPKVKQALSILEEVSALLDVPADGDGQPDGESRPTNVIHMAEYVLLRGGTSDGDGHPDGDGDGSSHG